MTDSAPLDIPEIVGRLRRFGVVVEPGLSANELSASERRYGVTFNPEHRWFLSQISPRGRGWWDWRSDTPALRQAISRPVDDILRSVNDGVFWSPEWGVRPETTAERNEVARSESAGWARLVPLVGRRYVPEHIGGEHSPVFSIVDDDMILYGRSLREFFDNEYGGIALPAVARDDDAASPLYAPWSRWVFSP
ncbi:hypothetical protein GCM10010988_03530 [Cnuibacter physcomitrellae]|uniref:Uncharacterized protein n=1 Tax=Cnuibacter physcomitrellae TaxID=1619308 RepID=A0A1X9LJE0_9MICO|nr:hypothetical protein [Cnuibacter physcomitrellae]ARJ05283.1 hypothetical protein B5808_08690 [Cnuibacter physcomitrellae]GGI35359.1 hypothetical protein GCM10010988_03530 [Cnuibacter physcomitrellae]